MDGCAPEAKKVVEFFLTGELLDILALALVGESSGVEKKSGRGMEISARSLKNIQPKRWNKSPAKV